MQHHRRHSGDFTAHSRRWRHGRDGRRAVESVSARARYRPPVPQAGRDRRRRRLSRFRLHRHAARIAAGPEGGPGARDHPVCRRGGRAACWLPEGRGFRPAQARLQLPQRHARHGRRRDTRSAARGRDQGRRPLHQLRRRTRLPVPVLVLHHHQRAGTQIALSHARRRGSDRARQFRARGHAVLRHRRQFRPQPQLGADPRSADRIARAAGLQDQAPAAGRHALPQDPGLHREGRAGRLQRRLHRA